MWQPGPAPEIGAGDIQVWLVRLDPGPAAIQQFESILSDDEQQRGRKFHFPRDRRRYVAARGTLRCLLGRYLGRPPKTIQFNYEPYGKPYLHDRCVEGRLHFNVSHSQDLALIGFSLDHRVGVDIEFKDVNRVTMDVAERFFAAEEVRMLAGLPAEAKCDAFFAIWTMKEAYIKARGEGVSLGLETFAVQINGTTSPGLLRSEHGVDEPSRWRFWNIDAGGDYAAAMAVEGSGERRVSFWEISAEGEASAIG